MTEPIRVLHVDDEPDFADLAAVFLEREDDKFMVETATSASEGIGLLTSEAFDCIVSDNDMPGQDGIEFLEAVREEYPDLPFILYTGKGSEEVASDAISAGVTDYLQKESGTSQYTVLANRIANAVEKYRSQRGLEASQKRLSLFIDQSSLGVIEWDEDFDLVRMNDAAEELLGYSQADLVGQSWEAIVPEGDRNAVAAVVDDLLENQGGYHSINENVRKDGDHIICEWHNRVITDESGGVVAIFSQFQDITERKERERAVDELHDTSKALMQATSTDEVAAIVVDAVDDVLDMPANAIHFYDEEADNLVPVAWTEYGRELVGEVPTIPTDESLAGEVFETGEPQIHQDVSEIPGRFNPETEIRSEIILPLDDYGVLLIGSNEPDAFDETDVSLAQTLTNHATTALDHLDQHQNVTRQRSLLEAQQEAVLDGILVVDEKEEIISYNDRFAEMWEIPKAVVEGGDDAEALNYVTELLANPAEFHNKVDYLYEHPEETARDEIELTDGRVFDRYTTPLTDDDGTYHGRLWTFRDISERKARETALKRERNRFEMVFETVPEPAVHVIWEGADPIIETVNDTFEDTFGYTRSEAHGRSVDQLIVPADQAEQATEINQTIRASGQLQAEVRRETVNGEKPFLFTAQTMEIGDAAGKQQEGVATYVDLTEQKRREADLARQNERLERVASILSHDLRNPLTVAEGRVDLARSECESEHLDTAAGALDRMNVLIDDVLTFAREGSRVSDVEEVDIAEMAGACWQNVETADASLVTETSQQIQADRSRLQQLLENLLRNAIEHGGKDVTITLGDLDDRSGFFVADDGPGIPEDKLDDVFEVGYSTADGGTGFGLSIVREIAAGHDWEVAVTSSEDGGARFEFTGVDSEQ